MHLVLRELKERFQTFGHFTVAKDRALPCANQKFVVVDIETSANSVEMRAGKPRNLERCYSFITFIERILRRVPIVQVIASGKDFYQSKVLMK